MMTVMVALMDKASLETMIGLAKIATKEGDGEAQVTPTESEAYFRGEVLRKHFDRAQNPFLLTKKYHPKILDTIYFFT